MVNYEYYSKEYYGEKLKMGKKFNRYNMEAEVDVNYYTLGRLRGGIPEDLKDSVRYTICRLIDYYDERDSSEVVSETTASTSINYTDKGRVDESVKDIIYTCLMSTGLLYRGV